MVADAFSRLCAIRSSKRIEEKEGFQAQIPEVTRPKEKRKRVPEPVIKGTRNSLRLGTRKSDEASKEQGEVEVRTEVSDDSRSFPDAPEPSTRVRPGLG